MRGSTMNENARNRNPEQIRQEKLFKKSEEQRAAAYRAATAGTTRPRQEEQPIRNPATMKRQAKPAPIEKKTINGDTIQLSKNGKITAEGKELLEKFPAPVRRYLERSYQVNKRYGKPVVIRNTGELRPAGNR